MTSKSVEQTTVGPECLGFLFTDISPHNCKITKCPPSNYRPLKMLHYYISSVNNCTWQCFLYQLIVLKPEERNLLLLFGGAMILKIGSICPYLLISCLFSLLWIVLLFHNSTISKCGNSSQDSFMSSIEYEINLKVNRFFLSDHQISSLPLKKR